MTALPSPAPEPICDEPPSFYDGTRYELDEIVMGMNTLNAKTRDLMGAHESRQAIPLKHAAEDIAKVAGQLSILAAHLAKVATHHVNRRPR